MAFDESNSPKYQKFKVDKLPKIVRFHTVDYKLLLAYYKHKYNKTVTPVQRSNGKSIPTKIKCPYCGSTLEHRKKRKHFNIHKCTNKNCSYYRHNLKKLPTDLDPNDKHRYKIHYNLILISLK